MRYGVSLPPFGEFADPRALAELAREAEAAGWDGFFIWDHIVFDPSWHPIVDPWVGLAAVALSTTRLRLGTLLTPLPRRRPWKLARETVSLDQLSGGRLTLGVGIGDPVQWEFGFFREPTDAKLRGGMLDEGLDVLTGLWSGEMFSFQGQHYHLQEMKFLPRPLQEPRIPIWVGGWWPNKPPMRRAARWDGVCPGRTDFQPLTTDDWRDILAYIRQHRTSYLAHRTGHTITDRLGDGGQWMAQIAVNRHDLGRKGVFSQAKRNEHQRRQRIGGGSAYPPRPIPMNTNAANASRRIAVSAASNATNNDANV